MSMKFLADNGGLQALIQAIKDQLALFDRNKQNKLVAGRGITINQSTRVISSDGEPNVQADWNMATESSASFIRNKPDIYTKREIDSMFSATITFVRVNELPATGTHGTVYLVPKQGAGTGDIYDEYLWLSASGSVEAHYELIGSTSVDLTNYYTKTQADDLLDDKVDKVNGKGLSTEDYTTAEKTKLGGIEAGAEVNVQSDWNQSDNTKDDYIKNKPTLRQPSTDGTSGQYLKSNGSGNAPSWETMDSTPTDNSTKAVTSGGVKTALDGYFPLAGKKAIAGVYKNAPSYIHNVDFGNTSTEGIWRKFCVISTRQTYRNAVGEIHINARRTQGTIYLTIGSSGTYPQEGENNTLSPSVKYLSLYNDYRPVYWRVNDDNELELWWKATQYYDSVGVTGVNFSPYFLSLGSDYNAGVNVQWTNVVSLEAPANLSQAQDVSLTTLDVSAGDVLTIDGDNYQDYLRTPSGGIPTSVLEADRIVLPRAYSTIFFDTTNTAKISYIRGASNSNVQKNGRRLTIAGNWKPREESSGDGRFTQYLYRYRSGSVGASQFADCLREAYEDFVYFNGIWYSKGY